MNACTILQSPIHIVVKSAVMAITVIITANAAAKVNKSMCTRPFSHFIPIYSKNTFTDTISCGILSVLSSKTPIVLGPHLCNRGFAFLCFRQSAVFLCFFLAFPVIFIDNQHFTG